MASTLKSIIIIFPAFPCFNYVWISGPSLFCISVICLGIPHVIFIIEKERRECLLVSTHETTTTNFICFLVLLSAGLGAAAHAFDDPVVTNLFYTSLVLTDYVPYFPDYHQHVRCQENN